MGMCDNKTNLLLMVVNGVTVLVGILVTICGVLGILNQATIQEYSGGYNIELVMYGVVITGVIILLVGAVGWYAGLTSSIKVCRIYCALILIIILLQAAFAVVEYLQKGDVVEEVESYMNQTFNGTAYNDMTNATQQIVDLIQEKLECCGLENSTDWKGDLPASCCSSDPNSNSTEVLVKCTTETAYAAGCRDEALAFADKAVMFTFYILCIGFFLEIMCIFAACWVAREAKRYSKLSSQ
ncbi:23 kDa integral membrane protein-like [Bolinopsis microptera]|uniref:23 kDa integral membrane protein-like n=1 Tax=Bolinopsis microptera TaxID=2820187 RepID=UPI003079A4B3